MTEDRAFRIIRDASRREVVERFLDIELEKNRYAEAKSALAALRGTPDAEFFAGVRKFADAREDTNTFLVFTVGVRRDERFKDVRRWVLAECSVDAIYTLGINPSMKPDLVSVNWNLKRFVALAPKYPEFQLNRLPESELTSVLFGLEMTRPGAEGSVALIDGSHRLVAMAAQGVPVVNAYIGLFRE